MNSLAFLNGQLFKSKDLLSFLPPGMGKGKETQCKKWHMCSSRHCCLLSWKKGVRVRRCVWYHPLLFTRLWSVQVKYGLTSGCPGQDTSPYLTAVLCSHILPLSPCSVNLKKKSFRTWRDCYKQMWWQLGPGENVMTVDTRGHGLMSGWSTLD